MGERRPNAVIVEKVPGFIAVNDGSGFPYVVGMLEALSYAVTAIGVNAPAIVPQSPFRISQRGARDEQPSLPGPPSGVSLRLASVVDTEGDRWHRTA